MAYVYHGFHEWSMNSKKINTKWNTNSPNIDAICNTIHDIPYNFHYKI